MSIKHIFNPKSISVIGASRDPKSVGYGILKNLVKGCVLRCKYCSPFIGKVFAVNPFAEEILGIRCEKSILNIKDKIDIAIIATPVAIVENQVNLCIKKGVNGVIIVSAGFSEIGERGKRLQDKIVNRLRKAKITLIGPNCLGIIRTSTHLNASFAPSMPPKGDIAFISQSGALIDSIIDWAIEERYGLSSIVSLGNSADKDASDFIEYFGKDKETKVITVYMEGLKDGKKFLNVSSRIGKKKPIIVVKAGRTMHGAKAVSSHTGSLAGDYEVYKSAFKQARVILTESIEEMFDLAKALSTQPIPKKNSIAIITNGGGAGVLCADYCAEFGVKLAEIDKNTIEELNKSGVMHPSYSRSNPLDIIGDALPERYRIAVDTLLSKEYISGIIVIQTLQTMTDTIEDAKIVIEANKKYPSKSIICTYMGGKFTKSSVKYLQENNIPDYNDVRKSAKAMAVLVSRIKK